MSLVDKRSFCLRVTHTHKRLTASCDMDEADREVSSLTDRAFRSLCVGDEAVYNDGEPSPCLLKPLAADDHQGNKKKLPEVPPRRKNGANGSNGIANSVWRQQDVTSILSAFATEKTNVESWDTSALRSIRKELAEFSTDFQQGLVDDGNFTHAKKHSKMSTTSNDNKASSSKRSGKDGSSTGKSSGRSKHGKSNSSKLRKLNSRNFFLHSEFSPFQAWKDLTQFPFGQQNISDLLPSDTFPRWCDASLYQHLTQAHTHSHTLSPDTHTNTLSPETHTHTLSPDASTHKPSLAAKTEPSQRSERSQKADVSSRSQQAAQKRNNTAASKTENADSTEAAPVKHKHSLDNDNALGGKDLEIAHKAAEGSGAEQRRGSGQATERLQPAHNIFTPLQPGRPCSSDNTDCNAPWRRNRSRATSAVPAPTPAGPAPTPSVPAPTPVGPAPTPAVPAPTPAGLAPTPAGPAPTSASALLEKGSSAAAAADRTPTSTGVPAPPRRQEVRRMEGQSSTHSTPFNITQLLTPVISRQETESLDPAMLPSLFSPSTLDLSVTPATPGATPGMILEPKASPESKARESYRSIATSLLFNLKDNRKRVKAMYSPPRFRPSAGTASTLASASGMGTPVVLPPSGAGTPAMGTPVLFTDGSPLVDATSALLLPGNSPADARGLLLPSNQMHGSSPRGANALLLPGNQSQGASPAGANAGSSPYARGAMPGAGAGAGAGAGPGVDAGASAHQLLVPEGLHAGSSPLNRSPLAGRSPGYTGPNAPLQGRSPQAPLNVPPEGRSPAHAALNAHKRASPPRDDHRSPRLPTTAENTMDTQNNKVVMETQSSRVAMETQDNRVIVMETQQPDRTAKEEKQKKEPKKSVRERVKDLQGHSEAQGGANNKNAAKRSKDKDTIEAVCTTDLLTAGGAVDNKEATKEDGSKGKAKSPPEVPPKLVTVQKPDNAKPAKQPPPVPRRTRYPPKPEEVSTTEPLQAAARESDSIEDPLLSPEDPLLSFEDPLLSFSARQNSFIKSQRGLHAEDDEEWDEQREVALLREMRAELEARQSRQQQGMGSTATHHDDRPEDEHTKAKSGLQQQQLVGTLPTPPRHPPPPPAPQQDTAAEPGESSGSKNRVAVSSQEQQQQQKEALALSGDLVPSRKAAPSLRGNTLAKRDMFATMKQPSPANNQTHTHTHSHIHAAGAGAGAGARGGRRAHTGFTRYDLATAALEEVIAEREERKRRRDGTDNNNTHADRAEQTKTHADRSGQTKTHADRAEQTKTHADRAGQTKTHADRSGQTKTHADKRQPEQQGPLEKAKVKRRDSAEQKDTGGDSTEQKERGGDRKEQGGTEHAQKEQGGTESAKMPRTPPPVPTRKSKPAGRGEDLAVRGEGLVGRGEELVGRAEELVGRGEERAGGEGARAGAEREEEEAEYVDRRREEGGDAANKKEQRGASKSQQQKAALSEGGEGRKQTHSEGGEGRKQVRKEDEQAALRKEDKQRKRAEDTSQVSQEESARAKPESNQKANANTNTTTKTEAQKTDKHQTINPATDIQPELSSKHPVKSEPSSKQYVQPETNSKQSEAAHKPKPKTEDSPKQSEVAHKPKPNTEDSPKQSEGHKTQGQAAGATEEEKRRAEEEEEKGRGVKSSNVQKEQAEGGEGEEVELWREVESSRPRSPKVKPGKGYMRDFLSLLGLASEDTDDHDTTSTQSPQSPERDTSGLHFPQSPDLPSSQAVDIPGHVHDILNSPAYTGSPQQLPVYSIQFQQSSSRDTGIQFPQSSQQSPVYSPLQSPVYSPLNSPVYSPLTSPLYSPLQSPIRSPSSHSDDSQQQRRRRRWGGVGGGGGGGGADVVESKVEEKEKEEEDRKEELQSPDSGLTSPLSDNIDDVDDGNWVRSLREQAKTLSPIAMTTRHLSPVSLTSPISQSHKELSLVSLNSSQSHKELSPVSLTPSQSHKELSPVSLNSSQSHKELSPVSLNSSQSHKELSPVSLNSSQSHKELSPVSLTPSQSNASSPTPGSGSSSSVRPVLFKVKDNTFGSSPVTKTVRPALHRSVQDLSKPWSPHEGQGGSDRLERGAERGAEPGAERGAQRGAEKGAEKLDVTSGTSREEADHPRKPVELHRAEATREEAARSSSKRGEETSEPTKQQAKPPMEVPEAPREAQAKPPMEVPEVPREAQAKPPMEVPEIPREAQVKPHREVPEAPREALATPHREVPEAPREVQAKPHRELPEGPREAQAKPHREVPEAPREAQAKPHREVQARGAIPVVVETTCSPVLERSLPTPLEGCAATEVTSPLQLPPSSQQISPSPKQLPPSPHQLPPSPRPPPQLLEVPVVERRASISSSLSEGRVSSAGQSEGPDEGEGLNEVAAGLLGEAEESRAPSEHSGSVCSGVEGSGVGGSSRKPPPAVMPKTEKGVKRAIKLTTRRIQKEEKKSRGQQKQRSKEEDKEKSRERHKSKEEEERSRDGEERRRHRTPDDKSERHRHHTPEEEETSKAERRHQHRSEGEEKKSRADSHQHQRSEDKPGQGEHRGDTTEKRRSRGQEQPDKISHSSSSRGQEQPEKSSHSSIRASTKEHKSQHPRERPEQHTRERTEEHARERSDKTQDKSERSGNQSNNQSGSHGDRPGRGGEKHTRPKHEMKSMSSDRHTGSHLRDHRYHGNQALEQQQQPVSMGDGGPSNGNRGDRRSKSLERDLLLLPHDGPPHHYDNKMQPGSDVTAAESSRGLSSRHAVFNGRVGRQNSTEPTNPNADRMSRQNSVEHVYPNNDRLRRQNSSEHVYSNTERLRRQNSSEHVYSNTERLRRQDSSDRVYPNNDRFAFASSSSSSTLLSRQNSTERVYPNAAERVYPNADPSAFAPSASSLLSPHQSFPLTQRKLLQDPDSGQYFVVDMPVQVTTRTFFDPETGSYVQLPVQAGEGASGPSVEAAPQAAMLNPSLVVYQSFVPMPVSSLPQHKASHTGSHHAHAPSGLEDMEDHDNTAPHWQEHGRGDRGYMEHSSRSDRGYMEPVYAPKDHTPEEELDSVR